MKTLVFLLVASLVAPTAFSQRKHKASYKGERVVYQTKFGRMNGFYRSYFSNGKLKAQGTFCNNQRAEKWRLLDTNGKTVLQRTYLSPYNFKQSLPTFADSLTMKNRSERNAQGFHPNFPMTETDFSSMVRVEREIKPENNPALFQDNKCYKLLVDLVNKDSVRVYAGKAMMRIIHEGFNPNVYQLLSFRLTEDIAYDTLRGISAVYISGFSPFVKNTLTGEESELFWVYFPDIRSNLAKISVDSDDFPRGMYAKNIRNIDDIFFFRDFSSTILSIFRHGDKAIEIPKDPEQIELELLSNEENAWMRK